MTLSWEDKKDIIIKLYIEEGKKLTEVQKIMVDYYNFHASYVLLPFCLPTAPSFFFSLSVLALPHPCRSWWGGKEGKSFLD